MRLWRWARRSPWASVAIAASLVGAASGAFVWLRWRASHTIGDFHRAALRAREALARGGEPSAQDLSVLSRLLPVESARFLFLRDPTSLETWVELERKLEDLPRGSEDAVGDRYLVSPRATIADASPLFEFCVPAPGDSQWHYRLSLAREGGEPREYEIVQMPEQSLDLTFNLPETEPLEAGRRYTWCVRLDAGIHGKLSRSYQPPPVTFAVVDPAVRSRSLDRPPTGSEALDRLVKAATLLAHDLAADSLRELDGFPEDASAEEKALARMLKGDALARLGDRKGLQRLKKAALSR